MDISILINLFFGVLGKYLLLENKGIVSIVVHKDSSSGDVIKGFMHALVMANLLDDKKSQMWMNKHYQDFIFKVCFTLCKNNSINKLVFFNFYIKK